MRPICAVLAAAATISAAAGAPRKLSLNEAIDIALTNNRAIAIALAKTQETKSARRKAAGDYYPQVSNSSTYGRLTDTDILQFGQGSFGTFPGVGSIPTSPLIVKQGDLNTILIRDQVAQPVTQVFRIREGNRVAQADEAASLANLEALRNQIVLMVRRTYSGLIAARGDVQAASLQLLFAEEEQSESEQEVRRGKALEVSLTEARTRVLQAKQDMLAAKIRESDLIAHLNEILKFSPGTEVEVDSQVSRFLDIPDRAACIRLAQSANPDIAAAAETVKKAEAALRAARYEYIPDVSLFARHDYQNGIAFLNRNYGVVGAELNFKLFDGGKRRAEVGEREAQLHQALENLAQLKELAAENVQVALNKIEQSDSMVDLAKQLVNLRSEAHAVAVAQFTQDVILHSKLTEAETSMFKARVDLTRAELAATQAAAELEVLIGKLPR